MMTVVLAVLLPRSHTMLTVLPPPLARTITGPVAAKMLADQIALSLPGTTQLWPARPPPVHRLYHTPHPTPPPGTAQLWPALPSPPSSLIWHSFGLHTTQDTLALGVRGGG